jgi:hypothetical protein
MTGRGFLTSVGTGPVVAATAGRASTQKPIEKVVKPEEMGRITLLLNGK